MYINPDTKPDKLEDYKWKVEEDAKTKFVLKTSRRKKAGASDKVYYIAIRSIYSGSFLFTASLQTKTSPSYLKFGVSESENLDDDDYQ
jgi:hypothetical protein